MTTSLKLKIRPSRVEGKAGTLYIRVIHNRIVRQINAGYKIYPSEYLNGDIVVPEQNAERCRYLTEIQQKVRQDMTRLENIIKKWKCAGREYTADDIVAAYCLLDDDESKFGVFARKVARHLKNIGKTRLSETYASSINSFLRFRGVKGDIWLDKVDENLIIAYEHYLIRECGLCRNTSSFYMRNLRAIYNRAVQEGLISDHAPFRRVYVGVDKTVKRAVSKEIISRMKNLDLTAQPELAVARDVYLLIFYLRGIPFGDLVRLETKQLQNGHLRYRRRKTNQELVIKLERPMWEIINRYHVDGSPYLLPFITDVNGNVRKQYLNALHRINAHLMKIGEMLKCPIRLTTYTARHGWASIARSLNIPISVISQSLGHESERTTRIYLDTLDNKLIDKANLAVINTV